MPFFYEGVNYGNNIHMLPDPPVSFDPNEAIVASGMRCETCGDTALVLGGAPSWTSVTLLADIHRRLEPAAVVTLFQHTQQEGVGPTPDYIGPTTEILYWF